MAYLGISGLKYYQNWLSEKKQQKIIGLLRDCVAVSPLFQPCMPRTGKPFSVKMTNLGSLGWVSDKQGYRYQPSHPVTGRPWLPIPDDIMTIWNELSDWHVPPEACLVNYYSPEARMGAHVDNDEHNLAAPIVSISLGDSATFRIGGHKRGGPTRSMRLMSGDCLILSGDARLRYHGIDRIFAGSSDLLRQGGRINLTLRRVNY